MNEEKEIKLPMALLNDVMNYLGRRPYVETAKLISELQSIVGPQVQPVPVSQEEPKKDIKK